MSTYNGVRKKANKTLDDLVVDVEAFMPLVKNAIINQSKRFTMAFVKNATLISVSPVDTSKLISNYRVSVGDYPLGDIEAYYEGGTAVGQPKGSTWWQSRGSALFDARVELAGKTTIGQVIYIVNNVDYFDDQIREKGDFFARAFRTAEVESAGDLKLGLSNADI